MLLLALTISRHVVICQHVDGDAHIEFDHQSGAHHEHGTVASGQCTCGHHHVNDEFGRDEDCGDDKPDSGEPDRDDPHDSCTHTDLLVDVGPEPRADTTEVPLLLAFQLPPLMPGAVRFHEPSNAALPPPGTGPPPRPRRFLAQRATTLLLI